MFVCVSVFGVLCGLSWWLRWWWSQFLCFSLCLLLHFCVSVSLCCVHCHFNFFRCRHFIRWRWWWCCHHLFTFHLRINLFFITAFTICTATLLSPPVIRVTPVTDLSHLLFWRYFVIFRTQTITDTSHILKGLSQQQLFLNYRFRCFFFSLCIGIMNERVRCTFYEWKYFVGVFPFCVEMNRKRFARLFPLVFFRVRTNVKYFVNEYKRLCENNECQLYGINKPKYSLKQENITFYRHLITFFTKSSHYITSLYIPGGVISRPCVTLSSHHHKVSMCRCDVMYF